MTVTNDYAFLRDGGEMGERTRQHDWSQTTLGTPDTWPPSLRTTLGILLHSAFPMFLFWGDEQLCFYNDAYRPSLGHNGKHPDVLGRPGADVWPEVWDTIHPLIRQVLSGGEATWREDQLIPIYRNGTLETVYWTFSYSLVQDEAGQSAGVLVTCMETTHKVAATAKLQSSEQLLQNIVRDTSVGMIVLMGEALRVEVVNDAYSRLIDRRRDELLGKPLFSVIPEAEAVFRPIIEHVRQTGEPTYLYGEPYSVWNADGATVAGFLNLVYQPYREQDGTITGVVVQCQDVTAQTIAKKKQDESDERFRLIVELSPVALAIFDGPQFIITLANESMLEFWGRQREEVIDKPLFEALPEARKQRLEELLLGVYTTGERFETKEATVMLERHGRLERTYFDFTYEAVRAPDTTITGVMVVCVENTGQVLARKAIEESENRFRTMAEGTTILISVSDETSNATYFNQAWVELTGRPMPNLLDYGWADLVHPDDREQMLAVYQAAFAQKKSFTHEFRLLGNDGDYRWLLIKGQTRFRSGQPESGGSFAGYIGSCIDITERKAGEEKLRRNKERQAYLLHLGDVLRSLTDPTEIKYQAARSLGEYIGANGVGYAEDRQDGQTIVVTRSYGKDGPGIEGIHRYEDYGATLMADLQAGQTVVRPDIANDPLLSEAEKQTYASLRLGATLNKPLVKAGRLVAVLFVHYDSPRAFSEQDMYLIDETAERTWGTIERALAEENLRVSEAKFRSLIEEASVATYVLVGPELILELANEPMLAALGKGPGILGRPITETVPELEHQDFVCQLKKVYATGEICEAKAAPAELLVEGVLKTSYYDYTYKPLRDTNGEVYAVMCMAVDVTESVLARRQIEEAEAALRGAVELAQLGTWSINAATGKLTCSNRMVDWFGYDPEAQPYNEVLPIIEADARRRVETAVAWALNPASDGVYDEVYTVVHPKTGQKRILHAQGKTVFDATGKAIRMNGTAQDITSHRELQLALENEVEARTRELEAANQDLQRSNENLEQFAYVASHDLQEPLRKIQSFGDLLVSQYGPQLGEGIDMLRRMQTSAGRMATLIRDLLTYSRMANRQDSSLPVAMVQVVEQVLTDLELVVRETGAVVTVGELPTVAGDPVQFGQLMQNLLSNAIKFRQPGHAPQITVMARLVAAADLPAGLRPPHQVPHYHRIDITDQGIGFDEKYLDRIFQVFQRLHGRNEFAGTGVGLAICEKVATNHGGAITATSQPGHGATFSVFLPQ